MEKKTTKKVQKKQTLEEKMSTILLSIVDDQLEDILSDVFDYGSAPYKMFTKAVETEAMALIKKKVLPEVKKQLAEMDTKQLVKKKIDAVLKSL